MATEQKIALVAVTVFLVTAGRAQQRQTFAPHELNKGDAPAPIEWSPPDLPRRSVELESAEERKLKVVVVAKHLEQPWSVAFLPDGSMLVTERAGRLRLVKDGALQDAPVDGVPRVQPGGPRGLQGLMDVALHPQFERNHWVYLTYHKPTASGDGATTLARGAWNGTALTGVTDIFESAATGTEASRIVFGRDGMIINGRSCAASRCWSN
jgi:glucose/arabinose dehydrogenase